ncbi:MAG TPA: cell division protein FtsB [Xanthomonadales bacterium]|nr:cell division protein FtsB [Xanthomonadales bacterium]
MRILFVILVIAIVLLQAKLWLGEGGYTDVQRLRERVAQQEDENASLRERNNQLRAEVEDLREGLDAVEERARSELGMIREGEEFYLVVPSPENDEQAEQLSQKRNR